MKKIIYAMRHGQKGQGQNPSLTARGKEQMAEATKLYLAKAGIGSIHYGNLRRHEESSTIAEKILDVRNAIWTPDLTIDGIPGIENIDSYVEQALKHPDGLSVGFRVDTWYKMDPIMMMALRNRFTSFLKGIFTEEGSILAICSSPLPESSTPQLDKTWLLNEAGIIKYTVYGNSDIVDQKIIFDGFLK